MVPVSGLADLKQRALRTPWLTTPSWPTKWRPALSPFLEPITFRNKSVGLPIFPNEATWGAVTGPWKAKGPGKSPRALGLRKGKPSSFSCPKSPLVLARLGENRFAIPKGPRCPWLARCRRTIPGMGFSALPRRTTSSHVRHRARGCWALSLLNRLGRAAINCLGWEPFLRVARGLKALFER